ncbi:MAG: GIY-YIG nuclease family protein [Rhizobiales bacterium]|nr:GIY-YIG nuclease family protein [Hyphomicrobiales bacterium]
MHYLYIAADLENNYTKIGIAKNWRKRLNNHSGNSSNPLRFHLYNIFAFETKSAASKTERAITVALASHSIRGKKELFNCCPSLVRDALEKIRLEQNIDFISNIPKNIKEFSDIGFEGIPYFWSHSLTRMHYFLKWASGRHKWLRNSRQ